MYIKGLYFYVKLCYWIRQGDVDDNDKTQYVYKCFYTSY